MQRTNKRQIGADKEAFVCEWLEKHGYMVLERNFRCRSGEIDVVAREGGYLVFIEVKYRNRGANGLPEEAVDVRKQRIISRVALYYLRRCIRTPLIFWVRQEYRKWKRHINCSHGSVHGKRDQKRNR